ncbi:helix-turn-helix transcriptional regulator [Microbacterium terregens]|uniref:LuxR C-terminal-related transcriptional regulator n=1 Tax=Microbacterium terregens TaxID=69363 RepID=A0ABV5T0H6_9MICO
MLNRRSERARLDDFVKRIGEGHSSTLLLDGGAGVGKTTLLDYLVQQSEGIRILNVTGIQSEVELAYAALHQLCRPLMAGLESLPAPQREALETTFGLRVGPYPNKFYIGLATLSLLSEYSTDEPLLCVIDDAQWLDQASAEVLGFVARRLEAEAIGMVFAVRTGTKDPGLGGIPRLLVTGLEKPYAERLFSSLALGPVDPDAMARVINEANGNPLVIVESARALSRAEIATGLIISTLPARPSELEEQFRRRVVLLPETTQQLLVIAAAEPFANPRVVEAAAGVLGISLQAAEPAIDAGLCVSGPSVQFRHPLVRSAVYRTASPSSVRSAHAALAAVSPDDSDPDLLAWHHARAQEGTDEDAAAELAAAAGRVLARGGATAAAALYRQALQVTANRVKKAEWSLRIAQAELAAGEYDLALDDLKVATTGNNSPTLRAELALTKARVAFARERGGAAVGLLLNAADELVPIGLDGAREAFLEAFSAAMFGASLADTDVRKVADRWLSSGVPAGDRPAHLLLDAMARVIAHTDPSSMRNMQDALVPFRHEIADERTHVHWMWHGTIAALAAWDFETWDAVSHRHLVLARAAGDYSELPIALTARAYTHLFRGNMSTAIDASREMAVIRSATDGAMNPSVAVGTAALQGRVEDLDSLVRLIEADASERSDGSGLANAYWGEAILNNSMGRYEVARDWATRSGALHNPLHSITNWALVESIEAASRLNGVDATPELSRLEAATSPYDSAWGSGLYERSKALLSAENDAEAHYLEALRLLESTPSRLDFARATLVYGEWLRRQKRLSDARIELSRAQQLFEAIGAAAFADRATRELQATGVRGGPRGEGGGIALTSQESQIAQLAGQGLTNSEIATRMFLSPRTVAYHLGNVFNKLQISSRHQLPQLPVTT